MNDLLARRPVPVESRRIPLDAIVVLTQPETGFSREVSGVNLSMSGMFLKSAVLLEVGEIVDFRFDLTEGQQPIHGRAEVVWVREKPKGLRFPKGLGMRFLNLDAECRRRIRVVVEGLIRETEAPPELRELRMVVEETLEDILLLDPPSSAEPQARFPKNAPSQALESRAMVAKSELGGRRWLPFLGIGVSVALALAASYLLVQRSSKAVSEGPDLASQASVAMEQGDRVVVEGSDSQVVSSGPLDSGAVESAAVPEATLPEGGESSDLAVNESEGQAEELTRHRVRNDVERTVMGWSKAWSDQDPVRYLSYYSQNFMVPNGLDRSQWEGQRKQRITRPQFVRVSLVDLEIALHQEGLVHANFLQSYRSDGFEDRVRKTLHLVREGDSWKITKEIAAP